MENKSYVLESSTISYTVGFENGNIYCELIKRLKECRLDQVVKIVQKKTSMSMGDEMSFQIIYMQEGKEKKFPWIDVLVNAKEIKPFFDDLKEQLESHVVWEDKRNKKVIDKDGARVYDLQFLPLGMSAAGLSRTVQLWLYMIVLGVLVFPLVYIILLISKGGYRIYSSDSGLEIKKFKATNLTWDQIKSIHFQNVNVVDDDTNASNHVSRVKITPISGKDIAVVMRYDHAMPLMKELVEKGIVEQGVLDKFS